jgi:hypothetical protein
VIKAKEIIDLVENSPEKTIEQFLSEVHDYASNVKLDYVKKGDLYVISSVFPIGKYYLEKEELIKFFADIKSQFTNSVEGLTHSNKNLNFCPDVSLLPTNCGIKADFENYGFTISLFGGGVYHDKVPGDSLKLEIKFFDSFLTDCSNKFYEVFAEFPQEMGNALVSITQIISNFRKKLSNPETIKANRLKLISDVFNFLPSGIKIKAISVHDESTSTSFYSIVLINQKSTEDYFKEFLKFVGNKLIIPLIELKSVVGPPKIEPGYAYPLFKLYLPKTSFWLGISIEPVNSFNYHNVVSSNDSNNKGVFVDLTLYNMYELFLYPSAFSEEIAKAIGQMFFGYYRIVNQFNNRPTKKTNADW